MTDDQREAIRQEMARLYQKHGTLTPQAVVQAAQNAKSPMHDCFEWDDKVAGQAFREDQARALIRSVRVEVTTDTVTLSAVAYVRDPNAPHEEQGYVSLEALRDNKRDGKAVLVYECDRVLAMLERVRQIAFALGLSDYAEKALAGVVELRHKAA
jgi:hypothetical protein